MIDRILTAMKDGPKRRMLGLLKEGAPRTAAELHSCLEDDLGAVSNVYKHVHELRVLLQGHGLDLAQVSRLGDSGKRESAYRLVGVELGGLMRPAVNGKAGKC